MMVMMASRKCKLTFVRAAATGCSYSSLCAAQQPAVVPLALLLGERVAPLESILASWFLLMQHVILGALLYVSDNRN